jgi:hypothetical protein
MKYRFSAGFVILLVAMMAYKFFNPAAIDGRNFFRHLSVQRIQSIELMPLSDGAPIHRPIVIRDRNQVRQFVAAWGGVGPVVLNHPRDLWSMDIRFHTDKGAYGGVLRSTRNQGLVFQFNSSPTGWPVASEYQLWVLSASFETALEHLSDSAS